MRSALDLACCGDDDVVYCVSSATGRVDITNLIIRKGFALDNEAHDIFEECTHHAMVNNTSSPLSLHFVLLLPHPFQLHRSIAGFALFHCSYLTIIIRICPGLTSIYM